MKRSTKSVRFERTGYLAIEPGAMFQMFDVAEPEPNAAEASTAVVYIQGPLVRAWSWCFDSYDAISARLAEAADSPAETIVVRVDSPGGDASGLFEAVTASREKLKASGKKVIAYVDRACSAGYAWACVADEIVIPPSGVAGSVGVISARRDDTEAARKAGVKFEFTMSGRRKAFGNPQTKITPDEREAEQEAVGDLAAQFFAIVADARNMAEEAIDDLEAGTFLGKRAVEAGLADRVGTFEELLAGLAPEDTNMTAAEMINALRAAIAAGGPEAVSARKELAALHAETTPAPAAEESDEEDDKEAESDEDDKDAEESDEDDKDAEESDEDDKDKDPPKPKDKDARGRVSGKTARGLARTVEALSKRTERMAADLDGERRRAMLDERPDISKALRKTLVGKPSREVKEILSGIPKPRKAVPAAGASTVAATQPAAGPINPGLPAAEKAALDLQMGLTRVESRGIERSATKLTLGAPVAVSALTPKGA